MVHLGRRPTFFGISYMKGDNLEIAFIKESSSGYELVGTRAISTSETSEESISSFRSHLHAYRSCAPIWIYLVSRNVALAKVFSVPSTSAELLETALANRLNQEIPYLSEEVVLHRLLQRKSNDAPHQVLLFGIPRDILQEQLKLLQTYGVVPDRVMLSTDVLAWMYRSRVRDDRLLEGAKVLVHLFGDQAELLFFEKQVLLQSRWLSWEADSAANLLDQVQSYLDGFEREWRLKPNALLLLGEQKGEIEAMVRGFHLSVERISDSHDGAIAPILVAAVRAYSSDEVFDFTLPEVKQIRKTEVRAKGRAKLALSMTCLAFSLFVLALVQVLIPLGQLGWLRFKRGGLEDSVREVRGVRTQALRVQDFRLKKSIPILFLSGLRSSIPSDLVLRELEYHHTQGVFSLEGTVSSQAEVDQFITALNEQSMFQRVTLERIQSELAKGGTPVYSFTLEGNLDLGELR